MRFAKRRADWRLGRWTAKCAIAAHLRRPFTIGNFAAFEVRPALSGAPRAYVEGRAAGLTISLSHSHGVAVCALAEDEVALGCDIEKVEPRSRAFFADYFTAEEAAVVQSAPEDFRETLVTVFWSAKESVLKATEMGLRSDPLSLVATPEPAEESVWGWRPITVAQVGGLEFRGWWRVREGMVSTLVATPAPGVPEDLRIDPV
jgi:4'-phosphopantetheinyl transferase